MAANQKKIATATCITYLLTCAAAGLSIFTVGAGGEDFCDRNHAVSMRAPNDFQQSIAAPTKWGASLRKFRHLGND